MTDRLVWDAFVRVVEHGWRRDEPDQPPPSLGELADAWRLLGRLLTVLATPIPRTDVTHSAAAAFCALPCVIAKLQRGTPYLLTEHGVYVREQYLNLGRSIQSFFVRWFLLRVISAVDRRDLRLRRSAVAGLPLQHALGAVARRAAGPDPGDLQRRRSGALLAGARRPRGTRRPLVVSVGLIFPLKGQLDLIEAAAIVRQTVPDLEVRLYGSASDATTTTSARRASGSSVSRTR